MGKGPDWEGGERENVLKPSLPETSVSGQMVQKTLPCPLATVGGHGGEGMRGGRDGEGGKN